MNENDGSAARGFDPDTAPDLSKGRWPEKFAKAPVRRGRPRRRGRKYRPPSGCPRRSSIIFAPEAGAGRHGSTRPCATGSSSTTLLEEFPENNRNVQTMAVQSVVGSQVPARSEQTSAYVRLSCQFVMYYLRFARLDCCR